MDPDVSQTEAPSTEAPSTEAEIIETTGAKRVWFNGELVRANEASISVFDHGLLYGDGVFEGIRAYNGRILKLRTHLERLYQSAEAIRLEIPYTLDELVQACRDTLAANDRKDAYFRLCVARGVGSLGLHPFLCKKANVFIIAASIKLYPQELYDNGMAIITARTIRNHPGALDPKIKSMNYLNNIQAKIEAIDAGVLEAIMLNHEGQVAECTGDNIFIVRGGELVTPPLEAGVLNGVTRRIVMQLATDHGLPIREEAMVLEDVYAADEMFLTGSAAEVIPVTRVDDRTIGEGAPGPVTLKLHGAFHELVAENAPED